METLGTDIPLPRGLLARSEASLRPGTDQQGAEESMSVPPKSIS